MSKIDATIFTPPELTIEETEDLQDLQEKVAHAIEQEEVSLIYSAYQNLIEMAFDLRQYPTAVEGLTYIQSNAATLDLSDEETATLHRRFGILAFANKDFETAKGEFDKGLSLAKDGVDMELEAKLLGDLANVAAMQEDFTTAIELNEAAIEKNEANEIDSGIPYYNLGIMYMQVQNYDEALDCFESALEIFGSDEELDKQEFLHLQLGELYAAKQDWKTALLNYHYASELQEEGSETLSKTYLYIVTILLRMNEHDKAIEYYEKAMPIILEKGDIEYRSDNYFQLANLYVQFRDEFTTAIEYYEKALAIAKTDDNIENKEWKELMVAKIEDSLAETREKQAVVDKKKSKKSGFFGFFKS